MNHNNRVEKGQLSSGASQNGASQNQKRLEEKVPEGASKYSFKRGPCMTLGERQRGGTGEKHSLEPFQVPKMSCLLPSPSLRRSVMGLVLTELPWIRARASCISTCYQVAPLSSLDQPGITEHITLPVRWRCATQHTLLFLSNLFFHYLHTFKQPEQLK